MAVGATYQVARRIVIRFKAGDLISRPYADFLDDACARPVKPAAIRLP